MGGKEVLAEAALEAAATVASAEEAPAAAEGSALPGVDSSFRTVASISRRRSAAEAAAAETPPLLAGVVGSTRARERALSALGDANSAASRGRSPPTTTLGVAGDGEGSGAAAGMILARVPRRSVPAEGVRLATAAQPGAATMPAGDEGSTLSSSQLSWLAARTRRANPLSSVLPARPNKLIPPPPQPVRLPPFLRELPPPGRREEGEVERRTICSAATFPCGGVSSRSLGVATSLDPSCVAPSSLGLADWGSSVTASSPLSSALLAASAVAAS